MYHSDMTTGWSVTTNIPVQKTTSGLYKNYTLTYFVMEKVGCCCCLDQSIDRHSPETHVYSLLDDAMWLCRHSLVPCIRRTAT